MSWYGTSIRHVSSNIRENRLRRLVKVDCKIEDFWLLVLPLGGGHHTSPALLAQLIMPTTQRNQLRKLADGAFATFYRGVVA